MANMRYKGKNALEQYTEKWSVINEKVKDKGEGFCKNPVRLFVKMKKTNILHKYYSLKTKEV